MNVADQQPHDAPVTATDGWVRDDDFGQIEVKLSGLCGHRLAARMQVHPSERRSESSGVDFRSSNRFDVDS